jgi:hypothetical protein
VAVARNTMGAKLTVVPRDEDPLEIQISRGAAGDRLAERLSA